MSDTTSVSSVVNVWVGARLPAKPGCAGRLRYVYDHDALYRVGFDDPLTAIWGFHIHHSSIAYRTRFYIGHKSILIITLYKILIQKERTRFKVTI